MTSQAASPSQAAIAAALGMDPGLVTRYKRRGMPTDSVEAALAWKQANVAARVQATSTSVRAAKGAATGPAASSAQPAAASSPTTETVLIYADARAKREHFGARQAEMDYLKSAGKLIDAEQAQAAVRDAFHELRDALGRLPRRIAGLGVGLTEPRDLERIVERELRAVLEAFAKPMTEALSRMVDR